MSCWRKPASSRSSTLRSTRQPWTAMSPACSPVRLSPVRRSCSPVSGTCATLRTRNGSSAASLPARLWLSSKRRCATSRANLWTARRCAGPRSSYCRITCSSCSTLWAFMSPARSSGASPKPRILSRVRTSRRPLPRLWRGRWRSTTRPAGPRSTRWVARSSRRWRASILSPTTSVGFA